MVQAAMASPGALGLSSEPTVQQAKCAVEGFTPHTLRHSTATYLIAVGVPDRVVMEILGHSSLAVTSRYEHVMNAMLRMPPSGWLRSFQLRPARRWRSQIVVRGPRNRSGNAYRARPVSSRAMTKRWISAVPSQIW
jgi:hypothetical protein